MPKRAKISKKSATRPHKVLQNKFALGLFIAFLSVILIGVAIYFFKQVFGYTTYQNSAGQFSLNIPNSIPVYYYEFDESSDSHISGGTYFSLNKDMNRDNPVGFLVAYESPAIEGKGGACVDENGANMYQDVVIDKQTVSLCEIGNSYFAGYLKNPSKKFEYYISTVGDVSEKEVGILKDILEKGFSFN